MRTSELLDVRSGQSVADFPFYSGRAYRSSSGLIAVSDDFDWLTPDLPARIEVWDIPPRKPLLWFSAGAVLLAPPIFMLARRRVRRLQKEAAA
jgi:hypothetical protein